MIARQVLAWCLLLPGVLLGQIPEGEGAGKASSLVGLRRATVTVAAFESDGLGSGSGFILTPEGLIATAAHVVRGARSATVKLQSGEKFDVAGIVAIDDARDFALIRIAGFGLPTVTLGNSDAVEVGRRLVAVGTPLGFDATVSDGLLSGIRLVEGTKLFQISVPVSPGSSGGPVATEDGKVVAMVVRGVEVEGAENLNFALPINYLHGQVVLAAGKVPIPFAKMRYPQPDPVALREPPGQPFADSLPGLVPAVVNESLGVDWRVLSGVEVATEGKAENGVHPTTVGYYAIGRTPTGAGTIESYLTKVWWQSGDSWMNQMAGTVYRDELRTIVRSGLPQGAHVFFHRTALRGRVEARRFELQILADTIVLDSGSTHRRGRVPQGVLPVSALEMTIAALPDPLPSDFYVWLLEENRWPATPVWTRIEFGQRHAVDVPIAQPGTGCRDGHYHTRSVRMDVLNATATIGARTLAYAVLAQPPHVNIIDAKCVRIVDATEKP
jgi:hypothetical protein